MARIGVQAMMLTKEFAEHGPFETLRRVRDIGYRAVEISQIPMTAENVAELARARDELDVDIASLSAGFSGPRGFPGESLITGFDKVVDDAHQVGATMVRIGMLPMDAMASMDKVLEFADTANEIAQRLAEHGIALYYHNHHIEFSKYDGKYLLDIIADRAPNVGLEIDVHWVQRGGLNPVDVLNRYSGRVAMVHLKDYRISRLDPTVIESVMGGDIEAFRAAFANIVQFAEVGEGNLDFASIIPAALAAGARYLLVEQDEHYGRTPLECLQTSHDNLVSLGFGDLF